MFINVFMVICTLVLIVYCNECDQTKCTQNTIHYTEIGCTPVFEEGKCCPSRFKCPNFTGRDNTKCYYQGESYELRAEINYAKTSRLCLVGCRCLQSVFDPYISEFYCAEVMCPDIFRLKFYSCIAVGNFDSCCATKYICDEEEKNKLDTCLLDGHKYYVGQRMYLKNTPCHTCYCSTNFNNSSVIGNEYCQKINCKIELKLIRKILNGCIPIYSALSQCCPIDWKCPSENDDIIKNSFNQSTDSEDLSMTCKYGDMILNVGDGITDTNKCIDCKCLVPPMAHCLTKDTC